MPYFSFRQASIHYQSEGEGSCLVLLHGFLENLEMWSDIIKRFSSSYRVVTIDLPGHGKSGFFGLHSHNGFDGGDCNASFKSFVYLISLYFGSLNGWLCFVVF